jgi:hypothetical protein
MDAFFHVRAVQIHNLISGVIPSQMDKFLVAVIAQFVMQPSVINYRQYLVSHLFFIPVIDSQDVL